ncbi:tetracycline repressor domain-containing protein [Mycolicibacterium neworleansense]|uniref:Tetracycline repressor domain-containing protein n=1 Tax=Mycolicibacterium neworleansense TaxID=146018 RepID=A0A0H5RK85_9MYCO|nr:tetracycline repressor domain-containing protein [Mycolicibacterium neworleansense]
MGRPPVPLLPTDRIASAAMGLVTTTGGFIVGFDPAGTLRRITLVDSFVPGSALDVAAPDEPWPAGADRN